MPIIIEWTKNASKQFEDFNFYLRKRILKKIDEFITGRKVDIISIGENEFRIRIGYYRIILVKQSGKYFIKKIGQRKNIYKNFSKK